MDATVNKKANSRIEIRVSDQEKELFEYASHLRGFNSFSEFIRVILNKESKAIIEEEKKILRTERDKEVFFNALMGNEEKPNESLISAIKYYNELTNS